MPADLLNVPHYRQEFNYSCIAVGHTADRDKNFAPGVSHCLGTQLAPCGNRATS